MSDPSTCSPPPTPALFTSTSSAETLARTPAIAASTDAASLTSICTAIACPPRAMMSRKVASSVWGVLPATTTIVSGPASASAIALPIPVPPPVTSDARIYSSSSLVQYRAYSSRKVSVCIDVIRSKNSTPSR